MCCLAGSTKRYARSAEDERVLHVIAQATAHIVASASPVTSDVAASSQQQQAAACNRFAATPTLRSADAARQRTVDVESVELTSRAATNNLEKPVSSKVPVTHELTDTEPCTARAECSTPTQQPSAADSQTLDREASASKPRVARCSLLFNEDGVQASASAAACDCVEPTDGNQSGSDTQDKGAVWKQWLQLSQVPDNCDPQQVARYALCRVCSFLNA